MALTNTWKPTLTQTSYDGSGIASGMPTGGSGSGGNLSFSPPASASATPPVSSLPIGTKPAGGLMAAATATTRQPAQTNTAATYNPTGYIAKTAGASTYNPATGTASTYDPTKIDRTGTTYDPTLQTVQDNQLVSNQLTDLTSGNSKYIQDARQQGLEQASRSGLMTSSIAAGNAERSAIQAALPIAQQDAARYGSVADQNMAATNTAGQFNAGQTLQASAADAGAENTAGQFNAQSNNQMTQANMDAKNTAGQFNSTAQNNADQFNANSFNQAAAYNANASNEAGQFNVGQINGMNQSAQNLAEQQYQYDRTLNAQQSNAFFGQQYQREQQLSAVLSSIYENPNLTAEQQQQAAANAKVVLQGVWNATNQTFASGVPDIFTHV